MFKIIDFTRVIKLQPEMLLTSLEQTLTVPHNNTFTFLPPKKYISEIQQFCSTLTKKRLPQTV